MFYLKPQKFAARRWYLVSKSPCGCHQHTSTWITPRVLLFFWLKLGTRQVFRVFLFVKIWVQKQNKTNKTRSNMFLPPGRKPNARFGIFSVVKFTTLVDGVGWGGAGIIPTYTNHVSCSATWSWGYVNLQRFFIFTCTWCYASWWGGVGWGGDNTNHVSCSAA